MIERCAKCGAPTHPSDSNDDGVCVDCLSTHAVKRAPHDDLVDLLAKRRWVYWIPIDGFIEGHGYRVSIIIEGERGHFPTGDWPYTPGTGQQPPWFWGHFYNDAEHQAAISNADRGYDEATVWQIVNAAVFAPSSRNQP